MTKDEMVRKVLGNLTVIEANETPAAEDAQLVLDNYPLVWEPLNVKGLTTWALDDDIPDNMALAFCKVLASEIAPEFEKPYNQMREGLYDLRTLITRRRSYKPVKFQDY